MKSKGCANFFSWGEGGGGERQIRCIMGNVEVAYRAFSHDVTSVFLVSQNNKTSTSRCPGSILWESNIFLMLKPSSVPINLHRHWSRE